MTKSAPKFNVNEIKCNGWSSTSSMIGPNSRATIETYISVYRTMENFEDIVSEIAKNTHDVYYGSRCSNNNDIAGRIYSALSEYALNKWENVEALAELWINAQVQMLSGAAMSTLIKEALRDCAGADHWYAFEKDWN